MRAFINTAGSNRVEVLVVSVCVWACGAVHMRSQSRDCHPFPQASSRLSGIISFWPSGQHEGIGLTPSGLGQFGSARTSVETRRPSSSCRSCSSDVQLICSPGRKPPVLIAGFFGTGTVQTGFKIFACSLSDCCVFVVRLVCVHCTMLPLHRKIFECSL